VRRNEQVVCFDGQEITWSAHICYMGSIIHEDGGNLKRCDPYNQSGMVKVLTYFWNFKIS